MKLGIDFGTCYSSAALLVNGLPKLIKEPLKHSYSFPSCIYVTEQGEVLVGQAAVNQHFLHPERYRAEFKRELGSSEPYILGDRQMLPEELTVEVIRKLKSEADQMIQVQGYDSIASAVITVPATYKLNKRKLMQEVGEAVGFTLVQLKEEPVAAAIYYARQYEISEEDIILVYDLGAGTFDATLLQKQKSSYHLLGVPNGIEHCGGMDFDRLIYQNLLTNCSEVLRERLDPGNKTIEAFQARAIVASSCRELKHQLSEAQEGEILIPITMESYHLTRQELNRAIAPLIEETLDCCEQMIKSANIDRSQVSKVLLVGGSCRIPYVRESVKRRLERPPLMIDQPELAVCLGAAICEASLETEDTKFYIKRGLQKSRVGNYQEAIEELDRAIHLDPHDAEAYYNRGLAYSKLGDLKEAFENYTKAIFLDPNYVDAYINRGNVRYQNNDLKGAVEDYDSALKLDPENDKAKKNRDLVAKKIAASTKIVVSSLGEGNYKTITEAIDNALPNSQIKVSPGIYQEHLIIDKPIEIIGDGASGSIIVQNKKNTCVSMHTNRATLSNLSLQRLAGENLSESPAVDISQGQLVLEGCDIISASLSCIVIHGPNTNPIIRNCQIHDGKRNGIVIREKGKGIIDKCKIFNNEGWGIEIMEQGNPTIRNCQIYRGKNCGIVIRHQGKGVIQSCNISANAFAGIEIGYEGNPTIHDCQIHEHECGIKVYKKGEGLVEDCNIFNNSLSGIQILEEADPTFRTCKIYDQKGSGILVLEKGKGVLEKCEIFANSYSGIEIYDKGKSKIRNSQIHANEQVGIQVYKKGKGLVEDCNIFNNALSGAQISEEADPTFHNCRIHDGEQVGIAVLEKGKGLLENCEIFANGYSGVEIRQEGNPTIRNCQIHNGKSRGISVWQQGKGTIENCEIFANAETGVEINLEGNPTIRNCQIHNGKGCGIFLCNNGRAKIENCQVHNNAIDPQTQAWECVRTLTGHGGFWGLYAGVNSVAFSPNGKILASASDDETIKLWKVETGRDILTLKGHKAWVKSVAFDPTGQLIASGGCDRKIRLWQGKDVWRVNNSLEIQSFSEIRTFVDHSSEVFCVAFSPDGKLFASGSDDRSIGIWQVDNGNKIHHLNKHTGYVRTVTFSPDSQLLATGSCDNTVKLWNTSSGQEICTFKGHSRVVNSVAFSSDGKLLASGNSNGTVKLWQVNTKEEFGCCSTISGGVTSVAFSFDGQILAGGTTENTIALWQVSTGSLIANLIGHTNHVNSVTFSPDGTMLASGSDDKTIKLWRMKELQL